eukprot:TRINITY_DN6637_c0_g1_i1.p1 TRINITY_DN6637_c0_g1~~TRINITY_DN6637_c0_g1_i1.p1  ORF type:complete len:391 (-),score=77.89 TRINITY_DN6637_c0_g1_i1:63-1235(-)
MRATALTTRDTVTGEAVGCSGTIVYAWAIGNTCSRCDWVGLHCAHDPHHVAFKYTGEQPKGTGKFTNLKDGYYTLSLYLACSKGFRDCNKPVYTSQPILVGNSVPLTVTMSGRYALVTWDLVPGTSVPKRDWIGLFAKEFPNARFLKYAYCCEGSANAAAKPVPPSTTSITFSHIAADNFKPSEAGESENSTDTTEAATSADGSESASSDDSNAPTIATTREGDGSDITTTVTVTNTDSNTPQSNIGSVMLGPVPHGVECECRYFKDGSQSFSGKSGLFSLPMCDKLTLVPSTIKLSEPLFVNAMWELSSFTANDNDFVRLLDCGGQVRLDKTVHTGQIEPDRESGSVCFSADEIRKACQATGTYSVCFSRGTDDKALSEGMQAQFTVNA